MSYTEGMRIDFISAYENTGLQDLRDLFIHGRAFFRDGKRVPVSDVFLWHFIPGKSHAHSRKIWRERRERAPVTIKLTRNLLAPTVREL